MSSKTKNAALRSALSKLLKKRGELNAFCERHGLTYNYVYRVAKGLIPQPSYEHASNIEAALKADKQTENA